MNHQPLSELSSPSSEAVSRSRRLPSVFGFSGSNSPELFEVMPIGVAVVGSDFVFHFVNFAFRDMTGLSHLNPCPFDGHIVHPTRDNVAPEAILAAWQAESTIECELCRDDGRAIWVSTKAFEISFDGSPAWLVWFQDISESREATIALRRSEERLALAVTGARLAVWEADFVTGQRWWSPEFYRMLGYRPENITETETELWERHLHPDDKDRVVGVLSRYLERLEGTYDTVYRLVRLDGSVMWVEVKGHASFDDDGRPLRLNGVMFDVTTRINAEEDLRQAQNGLIQAEKMAALGSLVAGVAHEINTPIGNTLTAASHLHDRTLAMRERLDTDKIRKSDLVGFVELFEETTRLILRDTQRAVELIQSFKQVAVDQTSGERRDFDLKGYIEEVFLSLRPRIRKTRLSVVLECPTDILMDSYPGALSQVLTNFVMNSLLHAYDPADTGTLKIQVTVPRPDLVEIVYSDDGKGMTKDVLDRVFDPFFTTKRGAGGSGLGMHIVFNIVTTTLRGTIKVHSEPGLGSRFTLRIPIHAPTQAQKLSSGDGAMN